MFVLQSALWKLNRHTIYLKRSGQIKYIYTIIESSESEHSSSRTNVSDVHRVYSKFRSDCDDRCELQIIR
jgi:hypothetical protein